MLRRISEPLALSEASLLALRPALNAPVLNVDFLPVGPARAAIVVFAEDYGGIGLAIGIRASEGGRIAVFRNREAIDESMALADVLEPALSSAEQMGFLFDEDMLEGTTGGGPRRSEATALWGRLMGDEATALPLQAAPLPSSETDPILDLTEPMAIEADLSELILDQIAPVSTKLSKFRHRAERPAIAAPPNRARSKRPSAADVNDDINVSQTDATSPLGRVTLVRVRRGTDGLRRIPYLARLLSSF